MKDKQKEGKKCARAFLNSGDCSDKVVCGLVSMPIDIQHDHKQTGCVRVCYDDHHHHHQHTSHNRTRWNKKKNKDKE